MPYLWMQVSDDDTTSSSSILNSVIAESHIRNEYDPNINDQYTCCKLIASFPRSTSSMRIMRGCSVISNATKSHEPHAIPGLLFMNPEICAELYNKGANTNLPELITDATQSIAQDKNRNNVTESNTLINGPELIPDTNNSQVSLQCENKDPLTSDLSRKVCDEALNVELRPNVDLECSKKLAEKHLSGSTLHILDSNSNSTLTCKAVIDNETILVEANDADQSLTTDQESKVIALNKKTTDPKVVIGSTVERDDSLDQETIVIDDDLEKVFTEKEMVKFSEEAEADRFRYGTHVASFLANNTVAIMMMLDNKMVTGAFRQDLPESTGNIQGTTNEQDNNTGAVREQFQYADPHESAGADHMLMSNTQGYLKGRKPPDASAYAILPTVEHRTGMLFTMNDCFPDFFEMAEDEDTSHRSKSFSNSVSEVFTEAFAKIEEMGQETRNKQFHKHFPDIPADEIVINSYSCAYVKDILLQGRLYVSKNWLCFHSNIFGFETRVTVAIGEVKDVTRERTALIVPNAIGIHTENEKYVFGSLMSRSATYKLITRILQEYRELQGLEAVPSGSRESSINDSELDTPDSENVVNNFDSKCLKVEEEEEETSFTLDPNSNPVTTESQRTPPTKVSSKSSFGQRMKEMVCAISVFKSLLRTGSSIRNLPHSQLFLVVTFFLIVFLFISALLLSFKVWRLSPECDQTNLDVGIDDQSLHGFLKNHERHSRTVKSIQLLMEEHLQSLAKVQDSLQYLHKSVTAIPESAEPVMDAKAKTNSGEL